MESTAPTVTPSSSLTFTDDSPTYLEMHTDRRAQQKPLVPPCALPQLVTNSALPWTAGPLPGDAANVVDDQSHKTRTALPGLLFVTPALLQNGNGRVFLFWPFLHAIKLSLYCMGMCTISLTISKHPHTRSALRSSPQHGEEK